MNCSTSSAAAVADRSALPAGRLRAPHRCGLGGRPAIDPRSAGPRRRGLDDDGGRPRPAAERPAPPLALAAARAAFKRRRRGRGALRRARGRAAAGAVRGLRYQRVDGAPRRRERDAVEAARRIVLRSGLRLPGGRLQAAAPVRRRRAARRGDDAARRRRHYRRHGGTERPRVAHVLRGATTCERGDDGALDGAAALFDDDSDDGEDDYAVLLFYKYARWRDRDAFRAAQEATCRALGLAGRLRIAEDGLNGTLGGPRAALEAYIQETRRQAAGQGVAMDDVDWKWGAADAARPLEVQKLRTLSVKACREVVAFSDCGGVDQAAIDAPPARKVDAAEFHSVLESGGAGVVLVDVRNVYERRVGRFEAPGVRDADLKLRQFSDLPRALDDGALDQCKDDPDVLHGRRPLRARVGLPAVARRRGRPLPVGRRHPPLPGAVRQRRLLPRPLLRF